MSRSIDLFIDSAESLADIASAIGTTAGAAVSERPDDDEWAIGFEEVEAHLGRHGYLDDDVLAFSRYTFCLSARVSAPTPLVESPSNSDGPPPPSHWEAVAERFRLVAGQLRARGGFSCLLVIDLELRDPIDAQRDPGDDR